MFGSQINSKQKLQLSINRNEFERDEGGKLDRLIAMIFGILLGYANLTL
jgi:hypothetical protein